MRNVERVRLIRNTKNTLTLGLVAFLAPEQELNTIKQAAVGVLGFVVISKKIPTQTQDHVMHSNEGESIVYVPYADRLRKR